MLKNKEEYIEKLETVPGVNQLEGEVSATIQGGYDLHVYRHANRGDRLGSFNFGTRSLSSNANDQISSIYVRAGRWRFYEHPNYSGRVWTVTESGGRNVPSWFNDRISSIRRF